MLKGKLTMALIYIIRLQKIYSIIESFKCSVLSIAEQYASLSTLLLLKSAFDIICMTLSCVRKFYQHNCAENFRFPLKCWPWTRDLEREKVLFKATT